MRHTLHHRLQHLEATAAIALALRESRQRQQGNWAKVLSKIQLFLKIRGIEKSDRESWMEALARAVELPAREVNQLLRSGIDPMHKYLLEHGVFEAIEREKAAGRWPSG